MRCGLLIYRPLHPPTPAERTPKVPCAGSGHSRSPVTASPLAAGAQPGVQVHLDPPGTGSWLTWLRRRPRSLRPAESAHLAPELLRPRRESQECTMVAAWPRAHLPPRPPSPAPPRLDQLGTERRGPGPSRSPPTRSHSPESSSAGARDPALSTAQSSHPASFSSNPPASLPGSSPLPDCHYSGNKTLAQ